jgi:hypothetical protein
MLEGDLQALWRGISWVSTGNIDEAMEEDPRELQKTRNLINQDHKEVSHVRRGDREERRLQSYDVSTSYLEAFNTSNCDI